MFNQETDLNKLRGAMRNQGLAMRYRNEAKQRLEYLKKKPVRVFYREKNRINKSTYLTYLQTSGYDPKTIKHYTKLYMDLTS